MVSRNILQSKILRGGCSVVINTSACEAENRGFKSRQSPSSKPFIKNV